MDLRDPFLWLGVFEGLLMGSVLMASLVVGVFLGLIPLVFGQILNQVKVGRIGFLLTVAASLIGGAILAALTLIGFLVYAFVRTRRARLIVENESKKTV